jgi:hypothetical protein
MKGTFSHPRRRLEKERVQSFSGVITESPAAKLLKSSIYRRSAV